MPRPGECIESFLSRPMAEGQRDVDARPGLWGEARLENCAAFFFLSTRLSCFFRNARERKPNGRCQFRVFENGSSLPPRDQRSLHWMSKYSRAVIRGQSGRGNKTAWRRRPARHRIIYFLMTKALPRASPSLPLPLSTPPPLLLLLLPLAHSTSFLRFARPFPRAPSLSLCLILLSKKTLPGEPPPRTTSRPTSRRQEGDTR